MSLYNYFIFQLYTCHSEIPIKCHWVPPFFRARRTEKETQESVLPLWNSHCSKRNRQEMGQINKTYANYDKHREEDQQVKPIVIRGDNSEEGYDD